MRQKISMTIETTIPTTEDEIRTAVEKLAVKVKSITVGKPTRRDIDKDGQ